MRTLSADNNAILTGGARAIAHRISVKDAGGTFRDLSTYPGVDLIKELSWNEDLDNPGVSWEATLTREQELISLAPLMQASPLNRGFNPAASYAALLQVGRQMKVEYSMQAEDDARARSWSLAFIGYIDVVDSGGPDSVKLSGRGLEAAIQNAFIQRERVYAFAQGANADRGCYLWTPNTVWVLGDRVLPTDSKTNGHFYRVTAAGTGGATEPVWPTGGSSTVADGGATLTESGATSTSTGTAVETVMQQLLDDNLGAGVVTLWCPVSPSWLVQWFLVSRQPTFDELKALADQIGWCLRFMDNAGTPQLKFFDPLRTTTTSLRSFGPTEVAEVDKISTNWQGIRNAIRVVYSDSQDLDPAGNPKRKYIDRTDSASRTKYGELFAEVAEASNSNIDTATEAQALADAVLSDLAEPTADMQATLLFFFAFVEICDLYTFSADGVHFDADQKLAVASFSHNISADGQTTSIRLRGKPASNGVEGWFTRMSDAQAADLHQLTAIENVAPITLSADTKPVGGTRISFTWHGAKAPKDANFELHLSTTPGFTPSAATLTATGKDRSFEVGNLNPDFVYYATVVPIIWNAQKPIRGSPSVPISFTPGRAQATHLNPNVVWGRLPLNGGFETQIDPTLPPDFWFFYDVAGYTSTWGVDAFLVPSGGVSGIGNSGGAYAKFVTVGSVDSVRLYSAEFSINGGEYYSASFWRRMVAGSGNNVSLGIAWYDGDHALLGSNAELFSLTDSVGAWVKSRIASYQAPAGPFGACFARIFIELTGGASGREFDADSVVFDDEERWHYFGASGEPAFQNSWVAFGSTYPAPRFKRTSDGWVVLGGLAKSGTINTVIGTLPAGYCPATNEYVTQIVHAGSTAATIEVADTGAITAFTTVNTSFSLEGIRFKPGG